MANKQQISEERNQAEETLCAAAKSLVQMGATPFDLYTQINEALGELAEQQRTTTLAEISYGLPFRFLDYDPNLPAVQERYVKPHCPARELQPHNQTVVYAPDRYTLYLAPPTARVQLIP